MSRLEKARAEKQQGKKKTFMVLSIIVLVVLAAAAFYLLQDGSLDIFTGEEPDLIDRERTGAFVDIFELTYVRVYLKEGVTLEEAFVNGEEMRYSDGNDRWELVLRDYGEGDQLEIVVSSDEAGNQELSIIVREM